MKALIVAESESILTASTEFLDKKGCDVIKYRWLMKALDNLEEIDPQIIIISVVDYPRHWKTFVQFINSTYTMQIPYIFLYSSDTMGENEIRKATWLGVKGIIKGFTSIDDINTLSSIFPEQKKTQLKLTAPVLHQFPNKMIHVKSPEKQTPSNDDSLKIMFSNPHTNVLITGKVLLSKGNKVLYICDNAGSLAKLTKGDSISNCMIKKNNTLSTKTIVILSIDTVELKLEIKEWP